LTCTNQACYVCKSDNTAWCLSCKNRASPDGSGACPSDCPSADFTKDSNKVCRCNDSKVQDGTACVISCPVTQYAYDGLCESCVPFCDECSDAHSCTKCTSPNKLFDGYCLGECPYYSIEDPNDSTKCLACVGCKTCSGTVTNCTSCYDWQAMSDSGDSCLAHCPEGYNVLGGKCSQGAS
jgi:proprotein convertase subtilisin/kexin type 5